MTIIIDKMTNYVVLGGNLGNAFNLCLNFGNIASVSKNNILKENAS